MRDCCRWTGAVLVLLDEDDDSRDNEADQTQELEDTNDPPSIQSDGKHALIASRTDDGSHV